MNTFVGTSMSLCVRLCTRGVCCFLLFFFCARHPPPGLLTRRAARTLADGEIWRGLGPPVPYTSCQQAEQLSATGRLFGPHTLDIRSWHTGQLSTHCRGIYEHLQTHTPISAHVAIGRPDCEGAKTCAVIIHFGSGDFSGPGAVESGFPQG